MADSSSGAGNIQDEPKVSYSARKYGSTQNAHTQTLTGMPKEHRSQLKELRIAKAETIWGGKLNYNPKYKTNSHESILI